MRKFGYMFQAIIIIAILIQLINSTSFAQTPQKMSYQAVIRNLSNNLVTNKPIGMRISIPLQSVVATDCNTIT